MSTTDTFLSTSADGWSYGDSATYATAGSTPAGATAAQASGNAGQFWMGTAFWLYEAYVQWDTSSIPDTNVISSATISLYGKNDQSDTDYVQEIRMSDWGTALTTADWIAQANLSGKTLVASKSTAGGIPTNAYTAFTSEAALLTNINKTGSTRVLLCSNRFTAGTQPTGLERVEWWLGAKGAGYQPKLVVVHDAPAPQDSKTLTTFSFQGTTPAVTGTIDEEAKTVALAVPYGTVLTALVATFATTGDSVKVGATPQVSGTTANNFTSPVTYRVTAVDASTQDYVATVTRGGPPEPPVLPMSGRFPVLSRVCRGM